jgi:hypothetical protein
MSNVWGFFWVHPTFANVRVIPTLVGIHTEAIYLDSCANGNDQSTKVQNEVFEISGCTHFVRPEAYRLKVG